MDEKRVRGIFMQMKVGDTRSENWYLRNGFTKEELAEMVLKGWLIKRDKDPKDFMSDVVYELTRIGFEIAWC